MWGGIFYHFLNHNYFLENLFPFHFLFLSYFLSYFQLNLNCFPFQFQYFFIFFLSSPSFYLLLHFLPYLSYLQHFLFLLYFTSSLTVLSPQSCSCYCWFCHAWCTGFPCPSLFLFFWIYFLHDSYIMFVICEVFYAT